MGRRQHSVGSILLTLAFALPLISTRCAERHYRAYDPYYRDYHQWDNNEVVFYNRWSVETHRDSHRDFRKLNRDEQHEYWEWRHNHH